MSEQLQRGLHPDADLLSAFAEGVLSGHERVDCVDHLASCAQCREIVFLAQNAEVEAHPDAETLNAFLEGAQPDAERAEVLTHLAGCSRCRDIVFIADREKPSPAVMTPIRRPWYVRAPVWSAAAIAALAGLGVWLAPREEKQATVPVAAIRRPPLVEPPVAGQPAAIREPQPPKPPRKYTPTPTVPRAVTASLPEAVPLPSQAPLQLSTEMARVEIDAYPEPVRQGSRIAGMVTDASGAFVPGAAVVLSQRNGQLRANTNTDASGRFELHELPLGEYDLRIEMPGFRTFSRVLELRGEQVAVVSQLEVGAVTETVDVTAATPAIQTESSSTTANAPRPLPSKLPVLITAVNGKVTLAVDSVGTLFRSTNAGRKWKRVKQRWSGKVDNVEPRESPISAFELTTEAGSVWLSRDGEHWFPAPSEP